MARPRPSGGPVLACFGHPDDAEISAGGTLAKWAAQGRDVHLLVLTNGDRGSNDPAVDREELARTRMDEVVDGGRVLGITRVRVLGVHDGELVNDASVRSDIARDIRAIRPTTVVTCDPTAWFFENRYYNHADHRVAGEATLDAVFPGAGNPHFFAEQLEEGLEPWSVPEVWLAWTLEPNHYEDIGEFMTTKLQALGRHRSQVEGDLLGFFEEWLPKEAAEDGRRIGARYAEAFRVLTLED